ncbi:aspartyl/glutamyl-tRNA(Asn/Gln) amidotransferase, B subunit [Treponema socranskii subsp. socranskii VPI DR56BR1116 = ATCC 35536]|uniref:Aspartyl/glutamyl-tRNA(Asn/Gln) amidotransferase subunit B n=1 Tax=Treponema socranskii subsp. socranskii VPI DR56BR1116 = ATCC 35536 TaxID=1125725 RepID=U2LJL8_TRESO|nr:Asp-tRNA(Asn)/Glu-tRNA(Gln) amidotransferase subunit GatB [Treponema socranskii]ERF60593.1 aspartyl/glutamyl-tRNA(Asn/Gln) amidotransferase, B subunit [Treponema socranskii subsp. socranskii VPI DR56BR1116 = ATCC 35536]ERK04628.1 aspartyl/glutamyl-tRNA(Asn/Gln) amidotransferase, B subunit [Treponema socranskii subsp. socranskii VPI DR56BR1116 = ATCC 35536]
MAIDKYEIVIGCEIHTQLLTKTKAFCACENRYGGMPDTRVCPVCLGLPGAMPRVSEGYVELGAVAGQALNCRIARFTKFDRKHYFYPDLAKGYQITQYDIPLCADGYVDLPFIHYPENERPGGAKCRTVNFKGENCIVDNRYRRVRIERIHLEEDVGKSLHLEGAHSYIDYNRCGTPLIEIVTKPDITGPEEAALFMQTVQEILRYVKVTKGNLEEGNMRCDANINLNVWENGTLYHTPISEIKNLNSFRAIKDACTYEAKRQLKEFETDRQPFNAGFKVTMGWDEAKGETVVQRTKNSFVDYRFVVEPDIKPFSVSEALIARAKEAVGELPETKRGRFMKEYSLSSFDAETLTATRELALWFEEAAKKSKSPKRAANLILTELLAVLNEKQETIDSVSITPLHIAELADALESDTITSKQGKAVFEKMLATKKLPSEIIKEEGMEQVNDTGAIEKIVESVLAANPQAVADFKNGKTNALGWLMGQVMKESHGKANPKQATELLKQRLS